MLLLSPAWMIHHSMEAAHSQLQINWPLHMFHIHQMLAIHISMYYRITFYLQNPKNRYPKEMDQLQPYWIDIKMDIWLPPLKMVNSIHITWIIMAGKLRRLVGKTSLILQTYL